MRRDSAFTLLEMMIALGLVAVLMVVSVPLVTRYFEDSRQSIEVSSARKLIAAYLAYPADYDGELMPGYDPEAKASDATGVSIGFPASARYPWRLAPYLDYDMHAILFNGNESALQDQVDFHYAASVAPNLGMNVSFVGGDFGSSSDLAPGEIATSRYGNFCVTKLGQAASPSTLIVFASARRSKDEKGFYQIKSPAFTSIRWSGSWDPDTSAAAFGYVDMRYKARAVAAMLDGHVDLLDENEIKDMRRWSNQAAIENNPTFTLKRIQ